MWGEDYVWSLDVEINGDIHVSGNDLSYETIIKRTHVSFLSPKWAILMFCNAISTTSHCKLLHFET